MSEAKAMADAAQRLGEVVETLTRVKGVRYANCVQRTLQALMLQEALLQLTKDKALHIISEQSAQDLLILGLLATGTPDSREARAEFTANLTMMTGTMNQLFRSLP